MGNINAPTLLIAELLARGWQWYDGALQRVEEEIAKLKAIPYFNLWEHFFGDRGLQAVGGLGYRSAHGHQYTLRVRIEYPDNFPDSVPSIFDHDHTFQPGAEGHLLPDWQLCLTFPPRNEFQVGCADLSEQVLGASLIWLDKRLIFEHNDRKKWPGLAEPHGFVVPRILLLLEQFGLTNNALFLEWVTWLPRSSVPPRIDGLCPCNGGRTVRHCHLIAVQQIYATVKAA